MPYWQLFYHIIWSTKNWEPLLTPDVEPAIYGFLRSKAVGLGATIFALNGVQDHIHLVVSVPPRIALAKFIGQVKAVASTRFNKMDSGQPFFWQEEYGVLSFDGKRLPHYIAYVERQKEHHGQGTLIPILERAAGETSTLYVREVSLSYALPDTVWEEELRELDDGFSATAPGVPS